MARTVRDAASMLTFMAGPDEDDDYTGNYPFAQIPDYASYATKQDLSGIRLGVPRNTFEDLPGEILREFDKVISELPKFGLDIVDIDFQCVDRYRELMELRELFPDMAPAYHVSMNAYLSKLETNPNNITDMQAIIDFIKTEPREEHPKRDIYWLERAVKLDYNSSEHIQGIKDSKIFAGEHGLGGALKKHKLAAVLAPSSADIPNYCAARGGMPVVSVPLGYRPAQATVEWNETKNLVTDAPNIPYELETWPQRMKHLLTMLVGLGFQSLAIVSARKF
jgi:amidase